MQTSAVRAEHFKEARRVRPLEAAEDYTELVDDLIREQGRARVCDISKVMGVSHVTVLKTVNRLIRDGYLVKNAQFTIELTDKGQGMAVFSKRKHLVLSRFLGMLGVPDEVAAADVEGIEHHISEATLQALQAHIEAWSQKVNII